MAEEENIKQQSIWSMDEATLKRMDSLLQAVNMTSIDGAIISQKSLLDTLYDEVYPFAEDKEEKILTNLRGETDNLMRRLEEFCINQRMSPPQTNNVDEFFNCLLELKHPQFYDTMKNLRTKLHDYNLMLRKIMKAHNLLMKSKGNIYDR